MGIEPWELREPDFMNCTATSVLLVDGHVDTLSMLSALFSEYETSSVTCASEAVLASERKDFDLFLVENWLPYESGVDLCRQLCANDPVCKVVFFSSQCTALDISNAMAAGAADYVAKPNLYELVETVHSLLEH